MSLPRDRPQWTYRGCMRGSRVGAAARARTPWPSPTFGPSPTAPRGRPAALFLPMVRQHRCRHPETELDVALVLDASTSMEGAHLEAAVDASLGFLRALQSVEESERSGAERRVALIRFHGDTATLIPPTTDLQAVAAILEAMRADPASFLAPGTRIDLGLSEGLNVLRASAQDAAAPRQQALILLTDGLLSHRRYPDALAVAEKAREEASIDLYAVGLGESYDARLLEEIVADPSRFAPAQDGEALSKIYEELAARIVCAP
jgi:Mg-chelatase subunit ChlD